MGTLAALWLLLVVSAPQDPARAAQDYAAAVEAVNRAHADKPTAKDEAELAARLPAAAARLVDRLVACGDSPATREALAVAAQAAADLDRGDDFTKLSQRLGALDAERARAVGILLSRPRFVALGTNGISLRGLTAVADVFDLVLDAYADVFGLVAFSKVPGKKLRLRVHLEAKITQPPHFAPQYPYCSEIDFPVIDADAFASPTKAGQFLFYGLCHELGHVIAMWGDRQNEADRHAWAHYTGVVVVDHLSGQQAKHAILKELRDVRWRSLDVDRKRLAAAKVAPGGDTTDAVLARLIALHDAVGAKAIGEAINALDGAGKHLLVNRVRYYAMDDFEQALLATKSGKAAKKAVRAAFGGR